MYCCVCVGAFPPCSLAPQYYTAPESVMEKVGIGLDGQKTKSLKDKDKLECRICCEEFTGKEAYALACNHFFCRGCWAGYLSAKVCLLLLSSQIPTPAPGKLL